jgi:branched-chain amino acid transport system ATP-binding protein
MSAGIAVENLIAGYGQTIVLDRVSFDVPSGGTLAVLGRNGVGKSTLISTLMGFTTLHDGAIHFGERSIKSASTHLRNRMGLGFVPQDREIFPSLTVEENLAVAARTGGWPREAVFGLFPELKERRRNAGSHLSGGEQQMLAVGRALVGAPKALLLDEPMEGLAPIVVERLYDALVRIRDEARLTIILVEQKIDLALSFARDVVVLDRGRIIYRDLSEVLRADEAAKVQLFGVSGEAK